MAGTIGRKRGLCVFKRLRVDILRQQCIWIDAKHSRDRQQHDERFGHGVVFGVTQLRRQWRQAENRYRNKNRCLLGLCLANATLGYANRALTASPSPPILKGRPFGAKTSLVYGNPAAAAIVLLKSCTETASLSTENPVLSDAP